MSPRKAKIITAVIVGTLLLCASVSYGLILRSCLFLNCVEERSFNAVDLGLAPELFPPDAIVNPMNRPSTSEGAFESGSTTVYWRGRNGLATYRVWRFRKEEEASHLFIVEARESLYPLHKDFFYQSSIADEFSAGCGYQQNFGYRCIMAARYQEYTIRLNSDIDREMTMDMFNEAIIFIDDQMANYLYEE